MQEHCDKIQGEIDSVISQTSGAVSCEMTQLNLNAQKFKVLLD